MRWTAHDGRRKSAWIAIFAILLQTLVPLIHQPANGAILAWGGKNICAAPGSGAPADPGRSPVKAPPCPVCVSLHVLHAGFMGPAAPVVAIEREADDSPLIVRSELLVPARATGSAQPRGPPASA